MVVRWEFSDPETMDSYTFEVNPSEGGTPSYNKSINYTNTAAPDGEVLIFEGQATPWEGEFSGTIFTEEAFTAMREWFSKSYPIEYTDDLNRSFRIYITSFEPVRERSYVHRWKHSYRVGYVLLEEL